MLKTSLIIIIGVLTISSAQCQNKIDAIRHGGYTISSYSDYDTDNSPLSSDNDYFQDKPKTNINAISDTQFTACLAGDAYSFFVELESYNTPLQRKIYEQDHAKEFNAFTDSLTSLKAYYKNSYQVVTHDYFVSSAYNLQTKTFTCDDLYASCRVEGNEPNLVKLQNYTFRGIKGVRQVNSKIEITVEDERKALLVEDYHSISVMVIFNRFDVAGKVYKPRKVIYYLNGEIIQSFGSDPVIDAVLTKKEPVPEKDLDEEDESGGGIEVGILDFSTDDSNHGGLGVPDSGDDGYGGGDYGDGDNSPFEFSGLGNWECVGVPTEVLKMNCTLCLVFRIDRKGRIISVAEDSNARSTCKYSPEEFDLITQDLKNDVQFRPYDSSYRSEIITEAKLRIRYTY